MTEQILTGGVGVRDGKVKGGRKVKKTDEACVSTATSITAVSCQHSLGQNVTNWRSILLMGDLPAAILIYPTFSVTQLGSGQEERC